MLKIGIVLNYKNAEKKKDELLNVNSRKMKWLSLANNKKYTKKGGLVNPPLYVLIFSLWFITNITII